jgi:long-subunit acyl-CoA synthetase (AMP-forming)
MLPTAVVSTNTLAASPALMNSRMSFTTAATLTVRSSVVPSMNQIASQRRSLASIVQYPFENLEELIHGACQSHTSSYIFGTRNGDKYDYMTYQEFQSLYETTRTMLVREFGIGEHDKVAMISNNKVEWASIMYATVSLGAQLVPM